MNKYWLWRIATYSGLFVSLWSLRQIMMTMGNSGYMKWFIVLTVSIVLSVMAALKYSFYKARRFDVAKTQQQVAVETLAELARQRSDKQK